MLKIIVLTIIAAALSIAINIISSFIQPSAEKRKISSVIVFLFLLFVSAYTTINPSFLDLLNSQNVKHRTDAAILTTPQVDSSTNNKDSAPSVPTLPSTKPAKEKESINDNRKVKPLSSNQKLDTNKQSTFSWEQGSSKNEYILSDDTFKIIAAPNTDAFPNTEARILKSVRGDYEASVKVLFNSDVNYQRATLGVRSTGGGIGIMRLSMLEGQRIEAGFYPENNSKIPGNIRSYSYNSAYLKIRKKNSYLIASYSNNKTNWIEILERPMVENFQEMEVFLSVLSTDLDRGCSAEFSELTIQQI